MEDTQPNEVRLSRKGSTNIPRVRITPRPRWQPLRIEVEAHLPRECRKGEPGSNNARKRWVEHQKYRLWTDRHLAVASLRYLDHDDRVVFTCTRTHYAADTSATRSHHLHTERIGVVRQARDSYSQFQAQVTGPSQIRPTSCALAGLKDFPQRPASIPSSAYSVEPSPTEIKPRPVRIAHTNPLPRHRLASHTTATESVTNLTLDRPAPAAKGHSARSHTNPVPRHRPTVHTAPSIENIIDLTLDHPDPVWEEPFARWSTFRSGVVDILLPPSSSGPTISSPEANTDTPPSFNQTPAQVVGQCKSVCLVQSSIPGRSMEDHPVRAPLLDQLRQHDVLEPARSNHPRDYSEILEVEADMLPSPPNHSPFVRDFTSACGSLPLSLGSYDKPRRILHDHDFTCVVTAHGIIDQVTTASVLKLDRNIRSPSLPFEEFVDDACILSYQGDPVVFLGHAREQNQISFLSFGHGRTPRHIALHRNWIKRPGVSAMTALMSPLKFASGGHDHRVHLWDIAQDLSGASAVELAIKHASLVHSLLPIVDTSHKLVSVGADCDIPIYDLSAERVVRTLKTSCTPHHAHKTDSRYCTLLEVSHLETQFETRDHRTPCQAVQRFGFLTEEKHGRFEKADSWSHFVVCGDKKGAVHLWDLRNVSTEVTFRQCFSDPVVQVVNTGPWLLACSKRNELACIKFQGE